jgi:MYXO-CTERM domain-containing protein
VNARQAVTVTVAPVTQNPLGEPDPNFRQPAEMAGSSQSGGCSLARAADGSRERREILAALLGALGLAWRKVSKARTDVH